VIRDSLLVGLTAARLAVTRPSELIDRIEGRRESKRSQPQCEFSGARADAFAAVHELLGVPTCGSCADEMGPIIGEVNTRLPEGHRHDSGHTLSHIVWVLTRHLKPLKIVETGVARGISSAFILDALHKNGEGHLWSIDLPPIRRGWRVEIGSAVPERLWSRWTYIRGSSRRALPPLLEDLDGADMFVHDGLHTAETMTFEFHQVWPYLAKNGVLIADDVNENSAFLNFSRRVGREPLIMTEPEKSSAVGLLQVGS